jgi:hypothetical protein
MVGDEVTLTCTVKNVSERITNKLNYQWYWWLRESDDTKRKLKTGKNMKLLPLTNKDTGNRYQCVVTCDELGEWSVESNILAVKVEGELSAYRKASPSGNLKLVSGQGFPQDRMRVGKHHYTWRGYDSLAAS